MYDTIQHFVSPVLKLSTGLGIITIMLLGSSYAMTAVEVAGKVLERLRLRHQNRVGLSAARARVGADELVAAPGSPFGRKP